jgi:hypothetical protein
VRLEDFESLVEALSLGDGPEDDTEEEGEDADDDKGGGGSTGKGKGMLSSEDDAWADVPDRVDLATCKALLAKYYPGEEVTPFARERAASADARTQSLPRCCLPLRARIRVLGFVWLLILVMRFCLS